jgi:hypothetical protein
MADLLLTYHELWRVVVLHHDSSLVNQICDRGEVDRQARITIHLVPEEGMEGGLIKLVSLFDPEEIRRVSMQEKVAMFADPRPDQTLLSAWWSPSE